MGDRADGPPRGLPHHGPPDGIPKGEVTEKGTSTSKKTMEESKNQNARTQWSNENLRADANAPTPHENAPGG